MHTYIVLATAAIGKKLWWLTVSILIIIPTVTKSSASRVTSPQRRLKQKVRLRSLCPCLQLPWPPQWSQRRILPWLQIPWPPQWSQRRILPPPQWSQRRIHLLQLPRLRLGVVQFHLNRKQGKRLHHLAQKRLPQRIPKLQKEKWCPKVISQLLPIRLLSRLRSLSKLQSCRTHPSSSCTIRRMGPWLCGHRLWRTSG